jgi:C-methyltransferase C-terminal domain/Methyltransferase domain
MSPMPRSREATCPACGHHVAVPFLSDTQPLATLAWPSTADDARAMKRLMLDFVRCVDCGHIFNAAFDYAEVPYSAKPNLMFNRGVLWSRFIAGVQEGLMARLPASPTVVEIGHGDGSFLAALAERGSGGRFVGFDPNGAAKTSCSVELRAALFDPAEHLAELEPDLIITRHVLEHLMNPLGFLQRVSFAAAQLGKAPLLYIEVPCVDRLIETGRTVDLYYEHNSHFTTNSFSRMLARCASMLESVGHGYDREVVYGIARLGGSIQQVWTADQAASYVAVTQQAVAAVAAQLATLAASGRRVVVWGGTGKSAAFMNHYGLDAGRFPWVVDSDLAKVGTFVPGTGQEIRARDWLLTHPPDVVIIPPQWRARDIVAEMAQAGISPETVLIEDGGRLVDFHRERHAYWRDEPASLAVPLALEAAE